VDRARNKKKAGRGERNEERGRKREWQMWRKESNHGAASSRSNSSRGAATGAFVF